MRGHRCPWVTLISDYPDTHQSLRSVSDWDIIGVIRYETTRVGATILSFVSEDARAHSLRSREAMAMYIARVPDITLMAI